MKMLKSKQLLLSVPDKLVELKNMQVITKLSLVVLMVGMELDLARMPLCHSPKKLDLI